MVGRKPNLGLGGAMGAPIARAALGSNGIAFVPADPPDMAAGVALTAVLGNAEPT